MQAGTKGAFALMLAGLVAGTLGTACGGGDEGETTDGGATTTTDGGNDGTPDGGNGTPDGGGTTEPPPRRSLDTSGTVTNSMTFTVNGATPTYPDGALLTQWAQVSDPADGNLYVSVTRKADAARQYLTFVFPRDARGDLNCSGAAATAHVGAGVLGATIHDSATSSNTCSFEVLENSATKLSIGIKSPLTLQGGVVLGSGVLELPMKAYAAFGNRAHADSFSIPVTFADNTGATASGNARVFINDGKIAATAVATDTAPGGGDGAVDVRVPADALGPVTCNKDTPGSVSISFMVGNELYAFASTASTEPCVLLVVRNDASNLTVLNVGPVFMPRAFVTGSQEAISLNSIVVDAALTAAQ